MFDLPVVGLGFNTLLVGDHPLTGDTENGGLGVGFGNIGLPMIYHTFIRVSRALKYPIALGGRDFTPDLIGGAYRAPQTS